MKVLLITFVSLFFIGNSVAEDAHHHHEKAATASLNDGKKWHVDSTMTKNMDAIKHKFHEVDKLAGTKKATDADYTALSDLIVSSTQDIIKNCKLDPKADETFHTAVLAPMLDAAKELKSKDQQKVGLGKVKHALSQYPQYFSAK